MSAATVETNIWMALRSVIDGLADSFPLDMPMADFTKPVASGLPAPYIEVRNNPNVAARLLLNGNGPHDRPGILQLSLMYPVALLTAFEVQQDLAAQIAAAFPADAKFNFGGLTVRVEKAADVRPPFRDDTYWRWPILVRWRCLA